MTVNVIKWKSDSPVSIKHVVWGTSRHIIVSIKSMHLGWDGILLHVGYFIKLVRLQLSLKVFMFWSSTSTLKSPKIGTFSYGEECELEK